MMNPLHRSGWTSFQRLSRWPRLIQHVVRLSPTRSRRRFVQGLCATSLAVGAVVAIGHHVKANVTRFELAVQRDGTAIFQGPDPTFPAAGADLGAGNDTADNNGIVRTYDTVTYRIKYSTDQTPNTSTSFSLTIQDAYHVWDNNQTNCLGAFTISPDRKTLTCTELLPASTTGTFDFTAFVNGAAPHGAELNVKADLLVDQGLASEATFSTPATAVKVSATPKMDLVKDRPGNPRRVGQFTAGPNGEEGALYVWPLTIIAPKGSEMLGDADPAQPGNQIMITDIVSGISPNARLYNWGGRNGCVPNTNERGTDPTDLGDRIREIPYGAIAIRPGEADRAVADSGTWACTQATPGGNITITITDADTSGNHRPNQASNGTPLNADETVVISGAVEIWIPTSDFSADSDNDDNRLTAVNRYDFLSSPSITGKPNVEPDKGANINVPISDIDDVNNDRQFLLQRPVPGGYNRKEYRSPYDGVTFNSNTNPRVLYPMTDRRSGDGVVMPDQVFASHITFGNSGAGGLSNAIACDKIDNRTQILAPHPTTGKYVEMYDGGTRLSEADVIIEYGTGGEDVSNNPSDRYYGDDAAAIADTARYDAQRAATCDDRDSTNSTWYTDPNLVPGGRAAITRVRVRPNAAKGTLPEGHSIQAVIHLQALGSDPVTGQMIPDGNILPNYMVSRADELSSGSWRRDNYQAQNHAGGGDDGDMMRLTRAIARITKKTDNPANTTPADDAINVVKATELVTFVLEPTLTAFVNNASAAQVIVTDILPPELTYVPGTAVINGVNVEPTVVNNSDQTTTLTWDLGTRSPNATMPSITFQARAGFNVAGGTNAVNTATIQALDGGGQPLDSSPLSSRTTTRTVTIGNSAAFRIFKDSPTPQVALGQDIVYRLFLANLSTDIDVPAGSQFIDILPFIGDGAIRDSNDGPTTPPTDYSMRPLFQQIQDISSAGFTFEFTNDASANISNDPNSQSPTTVWCSAAQVAGGGLNCPSPDFSDVTAIRMTAPEIKAKTTFELRLTLSANGNLGNDIYTNNFTGRPNHPDLGFIPSVDSTVRTPERPLDFGDAPDLGLGNAVNNYSTLSSDNGPRHFIDNQLLLGATVSADADGFANGVDSNSNATDDADDAFANLKDVPTSGVYRLTNIPVQNTTGGNATLHAWIDFNQNGQFEIDEYQSVAVNAGATAADLNWTVPNGTSEGLTYMRLRLTTDGFTDNAATPTLDERSIGLARDGEVEDYQLQLVQPQDPNVILVKRITQVNGTMITSDGDDLSTYIDQPNNPYDDNIVTILTPPENPSDPRLDTDKWPDPTTFLLGGINGGTVNPEDELEYTIYFLSTGDVAANKVLFCDRVPENVTYIPTAYSAGATAGTQLGIQLNLGGVMTNLTGTQDSDVGFFFPAGSDPQSRFPTVNCGGDNTNGAVVVNLGNLPNATAPSTPPASYGFVRFKGKVK